MSWTFTAKAPEASCPLPGQEEINSRPVGSEWTCDECGRVWKIKFSHSLRRRVLVRTARTATRVVGEDG